MSIPSYKFGMHLLFSEYMQHKSPFLSQKHDPFSNSTPIFICQLIWLYILEKNKKLQRLLIIELLIMIGIIISIMLLIIYI
jgi:hypothetical protein